MDQSGIQLDLGMPVAMGCGERSHDGLCSLADDRQYEMKRNSSDIEPSSPISSDSEDFKPDLTPPPTSKSKNNKTKAPSTPSPKKKAKTSSGGSSSGGGGNGEWTPEKKAKTSSGGSSSGGGGNGEWTPGQKAIFMDRVIAAGYKVLDLGEMDEVSR